MRALILDDEPLVLSVLQRLLAHRGYDVVTYPDATSCPLYFGDRCPCAGTEKCPDIILADLNMPDVNGVQFIRKLQRKGCKCRNIAMMSGGWTVENLQQASRLGVSIFAKPFHLQRLESWLGSAEGSLAGAPVLSLGELPI